MADRKQLEELFITLLLEDKKLESQYKQVVERAKGVAREIQTAIAGSLSVGLVDDKALDQAFDRITQKTNQMASAAREASQAVKQVGSAQREEVESARQASEAVNKVLDDMIAQAKRAFDQVRKAGEVTTGEFEAYRKTALETAESLTSVAKAAGYTGDGFDRLKRHVREATYAQDEAKAKADAVRRAQEELDDAVKSLSARVATQRNLWAARVTSDEEFKQSTSELRTELLALVEAGKLNEDQMRKVTQAAAYAQRGLDSANKVASRGGIAWTTQIALANQFEQSLRKLGPAGEAASAAVGIVSKEMRELLKVDPTDIVGSIVGGFGRLTLAAGAAGAALVTGVTVGLFRLGQAAAESAEKLTTAATRASLTVETFQEYAFAAEQSGVQVELLTTTLQRLQRRAVDAQRGNQGLRESFDRLGVSLTDAQGKMLSTEELFAQVADGLVGVEGDAERVALAFKIFDTEGAKLLPMLQRGSAGIQELRDRARELGIVVSNDAVMSLVEFKNQTGELQKQLETAKIEITAGFMPVFTNLLLPLIQNTVVPWLQTLAGRVNDFTTSLRDTGPAGVEFRNSLAQSIAPMVAMVGYAQAAGASLDVLNAKMSLSAAKTRQWLQQTDLQMRGLGVQVREWLGVGIDTSVVEARVDELEAQLERAQDVLNDAVHMINNPGLITGAWIDTLAEQVNEATGVLGGLGEAAEDAYSKALNPAPPPAGSLAALRAQLQAAQREFELAVTDEARAAAVERIRLKEAEINTITALMDANDPFAAANTWTKRLAAELRFGIKTASEVFDLIHPRIEELRAEAASALSEFGLDSQEYQETVGKLEILERLLQSLGIETQAVAGVSLRGLQGELQALIAQGVEPTSDAVRELLRQMDELELRGALEELRTKGVANLSEWARAVLTANGLLADAVRSVSLTTDGVSANVLDAPLAHTRFVMHQFAQGVEQDMTLARGSWDDFTKNVALGAASVESALNAPTEAFRIFQDTILSMMQSGADMQEVYDAIARSPFAGAFSLIGLGEGPDPTEQVGLIQAAYAEQQAAYQALQAAMTEDAIVAAGERYAAAQAEVARLEDLYKTPVDPGNLGESVREQLVADLTAAGIAAHMFGTENELAAKQLGLLESAIVRLLQTDPSAYVADLQMMWESIKGGAELAGAGVTDLTVVTKDLEAAQERVAQLMGTAPSEFDKLKGAFQAAAAAGLITNDVLREMLDLLDQLEEKAGNAAKLQGALEDLQIAGQITTGLTSALEGIRDGNVDSLLSGLTDVGAAIGTAIGGPMAGAIVQQVGQIIQALPRLFQAISDLFTGDSPARRKLRDNLAGTVAGAFRSGIIEGLRGADDWQENLRYGVQEAVMGALVDAFIQAAVMQAIFAPFIDSFTKILHSQGLDAAFAYFDSAFEGFWNDALAVVEGFVERGRKYFKQAEGLGDPTKDPVRPITFELPNATVGVLAAPQWALELTSAAERIGNAGDQMLVAAQMMQDTFNQGIPVTTQSTRGIDAMRSV